MKNLKVLLATAIAAIFSLSSNASAQYKPTGDDGITASPKIRQQLDEREAAARVVSLAPLRSVIYRNPAAGITASPKVREMLAQQKVVMSPAPSAKIASGSYQATGADGITASPKLRQQLNERSTAVIIAPLK